MADTAHRTIQGAQYLWKVPVMNQQEITALASSYNLMQPLMATLYARGMRQAGDIEQYLSSSYEKDVASPELLKDAQKAVDRLLVARERQERILIAGDYDVDGITSSALLMTCLKPLGFQVNFFLPHRIKDGYGLSVETVRRAAHSGYTVMITVDNGITAFEPAREARRLGIDLIITDHHRPHDTLPDAFAIIDPHQVDCVYPFKKFAGVGVGFKLMQLLYARLGASLPESVYELLLLGTVADVVPLTGENRFWVRHGLQKIAQRETFALQLLKENGRCTKPKLSSTDIGFFIAPQLNALGRLEDARAGVRFLLGAAHDEMLEIGKNLASLNQARKHIEQEIVADVQEMIASGAIDRSQKVLVAAKSGWQPGVIGLVASRVVGAYNRPAIMLHKTAQGLVKGSCRSIPEFNIFEALTAVKDLLISFGGHPMAAGLSLREEHLPVFIERINSYASTQLTDEDLVRKLQLDAELPLGDVTEKLATDLQYLEPFGCENPQPKFFVPAVSLVEPPLLLKDAHVKCTVFAQGVARSVIFFNRPELYSALQNQGSAPFALAAQVTENHWQGRVTVELQGLDIAF